MPSPTCHVVKSPPHCLHTISTRSPRQCDSDANAIASPHARHLAAPRMPMLTHLSRPTPSSAPSSTAVLHLLLDHLLLAPPSCPCIARARCSRTLLLVHVLRACGRDRGEVARRRRSTTSWERVGCKRASASACAGGRGDGTPKHERAFMRRGAPAGAV